jgi:fimbrial chaperone protein
MGQAACGLAFFFAAGFPGGGEAWAGSFGVDPVRATLSAARPVVSLVVRNTGAEDTVLQLSLVAWSQDEANDVYTPTREVLATPPIFKIAPGGVQVIRLGLRRDPDPKGELTYRLFIEEVPPPLKEGFSGLRVTLRIGIPVFVVPTNDTAPTLRWSATRTRQGELTLAVTNLGTAHAQIRSLSASINGQPTSNFPEPVYVLRGRSRTWPLGAVAKGAARVRLSANTDRGALSTEVPIAER